VTGGLRKLHSEELHNFYSSQNNIRLKKSRRKACGQHEEMKNAYKILVGDT
jgi:hypothetical protein